MLRRLDDLIIDRGFQKVADALCRWRSCYGIAAFLLTGAALIILGYELWFLFVRDRGQGDMDGSYWVHLVLLPLVALWLLSQARRAYRYETAWEAGRVALPDDRITACYLRTVYLVLSMLDRLTEILGVNSVPAIADHIGWMCLVCGFYFMACTPKRPLRQTKPAYAQPLPAGNR